MLKYIVPLVLIASSSGHAQEPTKYRLLADNHVGEMTVIREIAPSTPPRPIVLALWTAHRLSGASCQFKAIEDIAKRELVSGSLTATMRALDSEDKPSGALFELKLLGTSAYIDYTPTSDICTVVNQISGRWMQARK